MFLLPAGTLGFSFADARLPEACKVVAMQQTEVTVNGQEVLRHSAPKNLNNKCYMELERRTVELHHSKFKLPMIQDHQISNDADGIIISNFVGGEE